MKYTEQIDLLELEIMKFNQSDSRRIQHLVKVHRFAQLMLFIRSCYKNILYKI